MKYPYLLPRAGLFNKKVGIDKDSDIFSKKIPDKIKIELETSHISLHITGKIQLESRPILLYINKLIQKIYFGKLALFT